jgi:hypothetical protein
MSQDNKSNLAGWAALITAIAALITAIGFPVLFPDLVNKFLLTDKPVPPKQSDNPVPSPPVSPNSENTLKPLKDLEITVKDSETRETLDNADIEITYEKGIIPGRTLDNGTYKLPISPQELGAVKILVEKKGYQQEEREQDFSVNANEALTIYLEQLEPYTVPQESYYTVPPESYR